MTDQPTITITPVLPTGDVQVEEFSPASKAEVDELRLRLEAVEAFILRRSSEPIPRAILDAAIAAHQPPAQAGSEPEVAQ